LSSGLKRRGYLDKRSQSGAVAEGKNSLFHFIFI
jgi:hypothetical protein